jgi:ATP-dependent DNA helicase RecG
MNRDQKAARGPTQKNDRQFMEIAVEEMLQSRSEHANKFDPMVGVVIVDSKGRILARAHRGNFVAGEHAEFTAIMKAASDHDLTSSTLYTTLEPCTVRSPSKKSCTQRILESGIKRVVVGLSDPNPTVHGSGIQTLLDHGVTVDFFDDELANKIREANKDFLDFYERASLTQYHTPAEPVTKDRDEPPEKPEAPSHEEKRPVNGASYNDLSQDLIRSYLKEREIRHRVPSEDEKQYLLASEFIKLDSEQSRWIPTYAGLLLFGKEPDRFLPHFVIKALCFSRESADHTPIENLKFPPRDISGPLPRLIDDAVAFVVDNVNTVPVIEGTLRKELPEYPEEAIREIVVNAVIHRDYSMSDMQVLLEIYPNRIVVKSPGSIMRPITLQKLREFRRIGSRCRNPRIAFTFAHMHRMEKLGFGIPTLPILLKRRGLLPPEFDCRDGCFTATLSGRALSGSTKAIPAAQLALLNERQKEIVSLVQQKGRVTTSDVQKRFNITRETANRDFATLARVDLLKRMGTGRATYYILAL